MDRPEFRVAAGDALETLRRAISFARLLEETGWQQAGANLHLAQLEEFRITVLPRITLQITALAEARKAWWMAGRASEVMFAGLGDKVSADFNLVDNVVAEVAVQAVTDQAKPRAQTFAQNFNGPRIPNDFPLPPTPGGGGAGFGPTGSQAKSAGPSSAAGSPPVLAEIPCPGDCPPATVNILCQPHPDKTKFPHRVIFKFTSIDEATLNANPTPLRPGLGFTRDRVAALGNNVVELGRQVATEITNSLAQILPVAQPVPNGSPGLTAAQADFVNQQRVAALDSVFQAANTTLTTALNQTNADHFYEAIKDFAYAGLPCADISLTLAGRMTYQPVSYLGFIEGRVVATTAGTAGIIGQLYVFGVPLGCPSFRTCSRECCRDSAASPPSAHSSRHCRPPIRAGCRATSVNYYATRSGTRGTPPSRASSSAADSTPSSLASRFPSRPGEARVTGLMTKTNMAEGFACSPMRLGDRATFAINRPIPDPLGMFITSLDGTLESPDRLANFARQQADAALSQLNISVKYEFHPFGLPVADASVRVMLPDVLNHPALRETPWVAPEMRGQNLPSRQDVLIAGATSGKLGDAAAWFGTPGDFYKIFPVADARRAQMEGSGLDFRKDYFPHGGFVGGAQLAMPKMLQESPADWLPIYNAIVSDGDLFERVKSALSLLNDHILAVETNGQMAFYLPAPNPPMLADSIRTNGVGAARRLMRTAESATLVDNLRNFNPADVVNSNLYPSEVAFFEGRLTGRFLGIPFPEATITSRRLPTVNPGATPSGETIAQLSFRTPANSWVGRLIGQPIDFSWDIKDTPDTNILGFFTGLRAQLEIASNELAQAGFAPGWRAKAGNLTDPQALIDTVRDSVATQLPKFAFTNDLPEVTIYSPLSWAAPSSSASSPGAVMLTADLNLYGFSPGYAPDTAGDSPISMAMRTGGFAAEGHINFFPDSAFAFCVDDARFSITPEYVSGPPGGGGFQTASILVPHIKGQLTGLNVTNIFPGFAFNDASADFDNLATKFLRLRNNFPPTAIPPLTVQPLLSGRTDITADLEFSRSTSLARTALPSLTVDPLLLGVPLVEPRLALHGVGGPNARLVLSPDRLSAAGELRDAGGNEVNFLEIRTPGASPATLIRVSNLPSANFAVNGSDLGHFTATVNVDLSSAVQITILPGETIGNLNVPNFTLPFTSGGELRMSLQSDGNFSIQGRLDGALNIPPLGTIDGGATVSMDRNGATITGQSGGASATLRVDFNTREATFSGTLRFPPFCIFDNRINRICLSGPGGEDISFTVTPNGVCASGVELKLSGFHPNGGVLTVTLPELCLGPSDVFSVSVTNGRPDRIKLGGFELSGLDQFDFNVSGDFRLHTLMVQMRGGMALSGIFDAGFDALLNQDGFSLASRGDTQRVLGFDFGDGANPASLSATGRIDNLSSFELHFAGGLTLPFATFQMQGDIPANGAFTLQPSVTLAELNATPDFPLKDVLPQLKYEPSDYRAKVLASNPAGYWRLSDGDGVARDDRPVALKRNGTYQGGVSRQIEGAFGSSGNTAAEFNGSDGLVRIPPTGLTPNNAGFTVELWFRRSNDGDLQCPIFCPQALAGQFDVDGWQLGLVQGLFSPNVVLDWAMAGLTRPDGSPAPALESRTSFRDTDWHHVVAAWDGLIQSLYVDGRLEAWQSVRGNPPNSTSSIGLAAAVTSTEAVWFFLGRLDEVAIYQRGLSPVEVADHWATAGRGALRLEGKLNFFGLQNGPQFQGVLNQDGGWAVELTTGAGFGLPNLNEFSQFGLSVASADARVSMLHAPNGAGDIVSVRGEAQLPGFLGGGRGQRLRAIATSPNDFLFQVDHEGDLGFFLPFHLHRLRVERQGGNPIVAELTGDVKLVSAGTEGFENLDLVTVPVLGQFGGNTFNLKNTGAFTVNAGPAHLSFTANALQFGPELISAAGTLEIGNRTFSSASLRWAANGSLQLSNHFDTQWEAVTVPQQFCWWECPCNSTLEICHCPLVQRCETRNVILYHQRLALNLDVQREASGWKFAIGGTLAAAVQDCSKTVHLADFPASCPNPPWVVQPIYIKTGASGTADDSGSVTLQVNPPLGSYGSFTFDLW